MVERGLHLFIQISLNIGNHILASEGISVQTYLDIFIRLAEIGVLPTDFAERIRRIAGFRNILVYEYARTDLTQLVDVLNTSLSDFREYARYVVDYIDGK
ncbi:MAG: DUF86 domain-containing protein [Firmicutes bacterium]|nr:DUF86 domain-containing protein [Bacillota bacterium]